jgi:hypothetical protein
MKKVLFILNKHCGLEKTEMFYPEFLINFQNELISHDIELSYVFFSKNLKDINVKNKFVYEKEKFIDLTKKEITTQAKRIEKEYKFTFKQSFFPDVLQTFKGQDGTSLSPPEIFFNELNPLVFKFLYLEGLILKNNYDIIFSDVSPEYEMEFGRIIGNKFNKVVLKEYLGPALGNTVIQKCNNFGNFEWIEAQGDEKFDLKSTEVFIENFLKFKKPPYEKYFDSPPKVSLIKKARTKSLTFLLFSLLIFFKRFYNFILIFFNKILKKVLLYDKLNVQDEFLFFGFQLSIESTVTYKAFPYTNQIALIETISRVLPYNHFLYVREHPHWPEYYSYKFLKTLKSFPNVKIISPEISIHDILSKSKGVITLNSTTGVEALMHGKPVLSFSSNLYQGYHSSAITCSNLFELGEKLAELINTDVSQQETISYINRLKNNSLSMCLGSYNFYSNKDSQNKANIFAIYFKNIISKLEK